VVITGSTTQAAQIAIGWRGASWTNLPAWQADEFGVIITPIEEGRVQLLSYARPRSAMAYLGNAEAARLGEALAGEVGRGAASGGAKP
jgi:hypothetical protein